MTLQDTTVWFRHSPLCHAHLSQPFLQVDCAVLGYTISQIVKPTLVELRPCGTKVIGLITLVHTQIGIDVQLVIETS